MSTPQKAQSPAATGQSADQNTTIQIVAPETGERKRLATIVAKFALRGHVVHAMAEGGYLVCRHGYVRHCKDISTLEAFGKQVGAL